ncbi:hypothetical protein T01_302 [Trichinella spiralis]|uniref:Uncharacterized protein n=1 Tax=Trichinella spiralis TaxID=6334 RepID=A0A0V1BHE5_TRISP|nr:hypothetical protein T01_302 [Trichinella spiralis]
MDGIDGGSHRLGLLHAEFSQDVHAIFLLEHFDVTICTLLDFNAKAIISSNLPVLFEAMITSST